MAFYLYHVQRYTGKSKGKGAFAEKRSLTGTTNEEET